MVFKDVQKVFISVDDFVEVLVIFIWVVYNSWVVVVDIVYYCKVGYFVFQCYWEWIRGIGVVVGFVGVFVDLYQVKNLFGIFVMVIVVYFLMDIQEDDQCCIEFYGEVQ